jgi:hypothetical protein
MKQFSASTTINASPEKIWSIITDGPHYPEWDPSAIRIEGTIAAGEKLKAFTKLSPNRAFPVKVTEFTPGRKMTWVGGMPLGLFKGVRTFALTPTGNGTVDFSLDEVFSGPLLPLIGRTIPDMSKTFEDFCAGLKARAEAGQP